jgi:hypothetical protein
MSNEALDAFTLRAAKLLSRRTTLRAAGGSTLGPLVAWLHPAAAEARKRGKRKRKKKKRCKAECCKNADCGPLKLCAKGQCVVGQGTCPSTNLGCAATGIVCGPASLECSCFRTTVNAVRCGANMILPGTECGECVNDQDCAENHPNISGVFCVQGGPSCSCVGLSFCQAPCPQ